ncbi:MAG TPA: hypothetical protein VFX50_10065 [Gemmatimonadales bacterium]|nr:hypothetical protein [Gemmatimonadales bacterium]
MSPLRTLLCLALAAAAAACGGDELPEATIQNFVDSTELGALTGTPVTTPSAFSIADRAAVRTDRTAAFDFAFDIDAEGRFVFLPLVALGVESTSGVNPGLQFSALPFAEMTEAVSNNYITDSAVAVAVGDRLFARSRLVCGSLGVPQYGKLEIKALDPETRTIEFRYLVNNNCGYKSLQPGLPRE